MIWEGAINGSLDNSTSSINVFGAPNRDTSSDIARSLRRPSSCFRGIHEALLVEIGVPQPFLGFFQAHIFWTGCFEDSRTYCLMISANITTRVLIKRPPDFFRPYCLQHNDEHVLTESSVPLDYRFVSKHEAEVGFSLHFTSWGVSSSLSSLPSSSSELSPASSASSSSFL